MNEGVLLINMLSGEGPYSPQPLKSAAFRPISLVVMYLLFFLMMRAQKAR